jgi:hypothetical protein
VYCVTVWTNDVLEAICFLFGQYLISGTILFISRSYRFSGVRLKKITTGSADRGGVKR